MLWFIGTKFFDDRTSMRGGIVLIEAECKMEAAVELDEVAESWTPLNDGSYCVPRGCVHGPYLNVEEARADVDKINSNLLYSRFTYEEVGSFSSHLRLPEYVLSWKEGTVISLAQAIETKKDFLGLEILADALEEAGCSDQHILEHLRDGEPHTLGCWVVDVILAQIKKSQ